MKLIVPLLLGIAAVSQAQSTGAASTKGACSPANTGSKNTFHITCGIGKEQGDEMLKILNTIIANQLNPIDVMAKLDEILRNVNPNAPKVTYTFEGVKRIDSPGIANVGTEGVEAFQEIARLQRAKDWKGLIQISETQMKERPEWLTPYITAGQGYLILGQTDKAKNLLEYADKRIAGNPNYEGAQPLLRKLLSLVHKIPATQD